MRWVGLIVVVDSMLLVPGTAWAGIYPLLEPEVLVRPGLPFKQFQTSFRELTSIMNPGSSFHQAYRERVDQLRVRERDGGLTTDERLELAARLIRLREGDQAAAVLRPLTDSPEPDALALADLAAAYQLGGFWERARDAQEKALKAWPRLFPGRPVADVHWARRAEEMALKLYTMHWEEARRPTPGAGDSLSDLTEALFPGVRFVGDSGTYEPGQIAAARQARLPADAVAVVEQLLLWLPLDADQRLYWLLAELLNAQGDITDGVKVVNELVDDRRFNSQELLRHRQVLNQVREVAQMTRTGQVAFLLTPRTTAVPGALSEAVWIGIMEELRRRQDPLGGLARPTAVTPERSDAPATTDLWPERRRLVLVGGLTVVVVVLLAYLQGYLAGRKRAWRAPAGGA